MDIINNGMEIHRAVIVTVAHLTTIGRRPFKENKKQRTGLYARPSLFVGFLNGRIISKRCN